MLEELAAEAGPPVYTLRIETLRLLGSVPKVVIAGVKLWPHWADKHMSRDPLARSQGLNQPKIRPRTVAEPACLLHILKFRNNEILMGAPIGCPNGAWSTGPNLY